MSSACDHYVVFDTDLGTDDAWALEILLKAEEKLKKFKLLGITCVHGNTNIDFVCKNVGRVLNVSGRKDVPIFKGADGPILPQNIKPFYFHGEDGLANVYKADDVDMKLEEEHAVNAMYRLASKYPKKISFLLIGPLTNFALCLKMYSDFADKVKDVFIMGGNIRAVGNSSAAAEFNFHSDPDAAFIVLNESKYDITILPWETCLPSCFQLPIEWRLKTLNSKNPFVSFINPVEMICYVPRKAYWAPCDALLIAAFLFPKEFVNKVSRWHASVELTGTLTKGQMVLDHMKSNDENVSIIEELHAEVFKNIVLWVVGQGELRI